LALRSNFRPGSIEWAVRRAQWRALGLSDADMEKPKIAVVNSSSRLSSCYSHLDELSRVVQQGVRDAGGLPFELRTVSPSDFIIGAAKKGRYILPSRDLLVNDVEVMVEGAQLDGMVCLSSCDKTTPAHLMAAVRLDIPTILVIGGYQEWGVCGAGAYGGQTVDIESVYESIGAFARGNIGLPDLRALTEAAICSPGVCAGLATANTMHMLAEALGMALPGSAPIGASSSRLLTLAYEAGRRIVEMVADGLRPRQVVTPASIENAVKVAQAVGGSVNCVRHLAAVASEAGLDLDVVRLFEEAWSSVPLLCRVRPNGHHTIRELEEAGGTRTVLKRLAALLHADVPTVAGRPLGALVQEAADGDLAVVRPLHDPYLPHGGLMVLRGNLAPDGAIVRVAGLHSDVRRRTQGPARVFDDEEEAIAALARGGIKEGDVVVLRGMGPRGGPGTVFAAGFAAALVGAGLAERVAVVTDGELSGLNRGLVVGQVMPEAADGGPLALVEDGDEVSIDLEAQRIDVLVPEARLRQRAPHSRPRADEERGWLRIYGKLVGPIQRGAVLQ
jgi:dihydroxy-acid dehydratase